MLDSFFNKGFKAAKCKTLLKLTIPRIKLLRNRREIQLNQMRKDIAKLLETGQETTARIRVENIIREENMMAAQEIIELFCELIAVRLPIIEIQRECPLDLKEAILTICFAAPRCSDLPELQQVQMSFAAKYGKEFIAAATTELMPDSGVNRQIIELLCMRTPSVDTKLKLLKEIAEEHAVDWDPASTETEFLKLHEDLLNGPNHIRTSTTLPLPEEKHLASSSKNTEKQENHEPNSDFHPYSWDLPEVRQGSLQANSDSPPSPAVHFHPPPPPPPPSPFHSELEQEEMRNIPSQTPASESENPSASLAPREIKQFIPPAYETENPTSLFTPRENKQFTPLASPPLDSIYVKRTEAPTSASTGSDATIDLQDVLAAAQAAAETAERAATAARTAARLAQVRITELSVQKKVKDSHGSENEVNEGENPIWNQQNPDDVKESAPSWDSGSPSMGGHSPDSTELFSDDRKPQRSTSIEDDPYFSYPNLFNRQDSSLFSRSAHDA